MLHIILFAVSLLSLMSNISLTVLGYPETDLDSQFIQECERCGECKGSQSSLEVDHSKDGGHSKETCLDACNKTANCNFASRSVTGYCHMSQHCVEKSGSVWSRFRKTAYEGKVQFNVRSSNFFDLDIGQEDGNREFWFDAMTSNEARIAGDHKHPNGDVGPILFDPSNCKSTDTSESIIGNIYITTTNSGKEVTWKMLKNGCYEITIELNRVGCCKTLTITSTGITAQFDSESLGFYEYDGISNEKSSYKNKNGKRFLYYNPNRNWMVSDIKGTIKGSIRSRCDGNCLESCKFWETFETPEDPWTRDPDLKLICDK